MAIRKKITVSTIKNMKIEDERINDTELAGFHGRISSKGVIKYYFYYRLQGKQRNYLLGSSDALTPVQARDLAKEVAGRVAGGSDVQSIKKETQRQGKRANLKLWTYLDRTYYPYLESLNPKTADRALKALKSNFVELLDRNLADITPWDLQKWVAEKRKAKRAPATIRYALGRLKAAFNRAVEWGFIDGHDLGKVKVPSVDNTIVRYLSNDEESALLDGIRLRDHRIRDERASANVFRKQRNYPLYPSFDGLRFVDYFEPLIITAMNTGLRRGELLALTWDDVFFDERYLVVRAANAKSKKARNVPLNDTVFDALKQWRSQNPKTSVVFITSKYDADTAVTDIKKPWKKLLTDANIHDFRFHDLRHHFASRLVMVGVDLNTVRELLGHADMKMTLRYAHLAPEHKAAAVNMIG
ncbi:site-specific integrase [Vibrio mediterranei]|uniref:site-specific integrase n=1 Tax=Vibrio mediterranei TaxID=689 RepID=UPI001EFCBC80|nr:site-specific integrase [Vibrio mediterranei]MCG9626920.1 site-specific integrase [Vibrio mediterranei]